MKRPTLCLLPLLLAAAPATAGEQRYAALGTEPFWSLTLNGRVLKLDELGRRAVRAGGASIRPTASGQRVAARGMTVDIVRARCSDGMSDRVYADTVVVRVGRRVLRGCGGLFPVAR